MSKKETLLCRAILASKQQCLDLRNKRESLEITQKELAKVSNLSLRTITRIDRGDDNIGIHVLNLYRQGLLEISSKSKNDKL